MIRCVRFEAQRRELECLPVRQREPAACDSIEVEQQRGLPDAAFSGDQDVLRIAVLRLEESLLKGGDLAEAAGEHPWRHRRPGPKRIEAHGYLSSIRFGPGRR